MCDCASGQKRFLSLTTGSTHAAYIESMVDNPIDRLRIATPCSTSWEQMPGDERVRHCAVCSLNVYNLAEMTRDEVRELLARSEGRVCVRLYRRADGTVLTRDCPKGLRELGRRASRAAVAAVAALLSLPAFGFTLPWKRHPGFEVKLTTEQLATAQPAAFRGVVVMDGSPLPGVTVALRDEITGHEVTTVTDGKGTFTFQGVTDGTYRADLALAGFKPAGIKHLELKAGAVVQASVAMQVAELESITVGGAELSPLEQPTISTTFLQSFIDKLPF